MSEKEISNTEILEAVISLTNEVGNLRTHVSTLNDRVNALPETMQAMIDDAKEELLEEIRPISRAVDKDAETVLHHEKRITHLELSRA